nr:MAG TPA: hypothetical protein [Caudoviricetes sp.]
MFLTIYIICKLQPLSSRLLVAFTPFNPAFAVIGSFTLPEWGFGFEVVHNYLFNIIKTIT